ncbi:MAG TPA: hypothetical protein VEZ12_23080, partial [Herpetosiphonaceae bacterium]|nr:hypothetical protein [Herpetosiphonaceae bacterium]
MLRQRRRRWLLALFIVLAAPVSLQRPPAVLAAPRCFVETQQCLDGSFLEYWEQHGGLAVFGFPISPATDEMNLDTRQIYLTQWFERARFEQHAENQRPYHVLLGRLGADGLRKASVDWRQRPAAEGPRSGCLWFADTRHNVCDQEAGRGFRTYWATHGLEFDGRRGTSYEESLALFGQPLTEPALETNSSGDTVLTQWFERARFEWHPTNPEPYRVLLGHLGRETRAPLVRTQNPGLPGELILHTGDTLHAVKADGSTARFLQIVSPSDAHTFVVSPDGTRVAGRSSHNGGTGVTSMNLDGSRARRINDDSSAVVQSWSPDGRRIVYSSGLEGRRGLYVIDVDGTQEIKLMEGTPGLMPTGGSWSPDGRQIAFATLYSDS